MFGIDASEFLVIAIVAIVVIGPKDLPLALRTAGKWIAQMRRISGHFRAGFDAMVREAEMEELEKKWAEQNAKIMREHPNGVEEAERTGAYPAPRMEPLAAPEAPPVSTEAAVLPEGQPADYAGMPAREPKAGE